MLQACIVWGRHYSRNSAKPRRADTYKTPQSPLDVEGRYRSLVGPFVLYGDAVLHIKIGVGKGNPGKPRARQCMETRGERTPGVPLTFVTIAVANERRIRTICELEARRRQSKVSVWGVGGGSHDHA